MKPDIVYSTWLRFNTWVQALCAPDFKPIKPVGFLPARIMSVCDGILDDAKHLYLLQMTICDCQFFTWENTSHLKPILEDIHCFKARIRLRQVISNILELRRYLKRL